MAYGQVLGQEAARRRLGNVPGRPIILEWTGAFAPHHERKREVAATSGSSQTARGVQGGGASGMPSCAASRPVRCERRRAVG